jgi:hypothetical protein
MADRVQFQQALVNLMLNRIEATLGTGGELWIQSDLASNGQLLVSIRDTGSSPQKLEVQVWDCALPVPLSNRMVGALRTPAPGTTFEFLLPQTTTADVTSSNEPTLFHG